MTDSTVEIQGRTLKVSNLEKVLYPATGFTKKDVIDYYARIAAAIGPYDRYAENRDAHNNVMRMHRDASYAIPDSTLTDTALLEALNAALRTD